MWGYAYYGVSEVVSNVCTGGVSVVQGGMLKGRDHAGGLLSEQYTYDTSGRVVGSRKFPPSSMGDLVNYPWFCVAYDFRDRPVTMSVPAVASNSYGMARSTTFTYAYGGSSLVTRQTETVGSTSRSIVTSSTGTGLLSSYTDALGQTTSYAYDQAMRVTGSTGPQGNVTFTYKSATGVPDQMLLGSTVLASSVYNDLGELSDVAYGNGVTGAYQYDASGRLTDRWFTKAGGLVTRDQVSRSRSGRVTDEAIDGVALDVANVDFLYDGAGRMVQSKNPGPSGTATQMYGYGPVGCSGVSGLVNANNNAGRNGEVTTATITGGSFPGSFWYCFDTADRLLSYGTGSTPTAQPAVASWDTHANMTTVLGSKTFTYDQTDRHMSSGFPASGWEALIRDPTGRVIGRDYSSGDHARYGYINGSDNPAFTRNVANTATLEQIIPLPGGTTFTKRSTSTETWAHANIHGDITATTNNTGQKPNATIKYLPAGTLADGTLPDALTGGHEYGWLGAYRRPTSTDTTTWPTIELGARPYIPALNTFTQPDPIEGGNTNAYGYPPDPINQSDLTGQRVTGTCGSTSLYIILGISITSCEVQDENGNSGTLTSYSYGVGLDVSASAGILYSEAKSVTDLTGWSNCTSGGVGPLSGSVCIWPGNNRDMASAVIFGPGVGFNAGAEVGSSYSIYRPGTVAWAPSKCDLTPSCRRNRPRDVY